MRKESPIDHLVGQLAGVILKLEVVSRKEVILCLFGITTKNGPRARNVRRLGPPHRSIARTLVFRVLAILFSYILLLFYLWKDYIVIEKHKKKL